MSHGWIECTCRSCAHRFYIRQLSDFAYGEFIVFTERGDACAYLNAFAGPVFDEVSTLVNQALQNRGFSEKAIADRFQYVFGVACDTIKGQPLNICAKPSCPQCYSRELAMSGNPCPPEFQIEPAPVSYEKWNALAPDEKRALVLQELRTRGLM